MKIVERMRVSSITRGGQISIPAFIRKRWGAPNVSIEDFGDHLVLRPLPEDVLASLRGSVSLRSDMTLEEIREEARREEAEQEERRWGR